jgi:hypothetical protein
VTGGSARGTSDAERCSSSGTASWAASISITAYLIGHAAGGIFAAIGAALAAAILLFTGTLVWRNNLRG